MFKFIANFMILKILILLFLLRFGSNFSFSQCILLLEKPGTVNNTKFRVGNRIDVKTINNERINGLINQIRDTAIIVNYNLIKLSEIKIIYTRRTMISVFSHLGIKGGLGYVGIDGFNNLINNEKPVFRNSTLKTSGIMFVTGVLLKSISNRKRHINNEKWRLKVLNFNLLKDPGIYNKTLQEPEIKYPIND
jgi:hypothetical protein